MDVVALSRWQFAITTVYHFLFVPLTIGLSGLVAIMQTIWWRTGRQHWLDLTHFFGKLFLINFALGVVTGLVQEFQFGMNWSAYSRFVGDVFGAPLALEGLLAFFVESTFLGLWIFGWDRLPKVVHLACLWIAALGTVLSAFFILVANSFMQHPVGYTIDAATGRARLTDVWAVLTNPVAMVTFPHQILASYLVAGAFLAGVAGWQLHRIARLNRAVAGATGADGAAGADEDTADETAPERVRAWRGALALGAIVLIITGVGVAISGDAQGKVMTDVQPMKMAAAEALYTTEQPASFSIFTLGTLDGQHEVWALKVPYLLSFLATGHVDASVQGIDQLEQQYQQTYGPGEYAPNIPLAYWTFRLMIGVGMISVLGGIVLLWLVRKPRAGSHWPVGIPAGRWFTAAMVLMPLFPLIANSFGWIFTETGRQPWLVFGLLRTADGVSPTITPAMVIASLALFTLTYGGLAVVEVRLMLRSIRAGLGGGRPEAEPAEAEQPLSFSY